MMQPTSQKPTTKCPACGAAIPQTKKTCPGCGKHQNLSDGGFDFEKPRSYTPKHLADKIFAHKNAIEGERKHVSVLFADVANSTAIFEMMDPEDVHQVMDGCFEIILNAVHRYEGTINQFTGDGVMAIFGAPSAHEKHAHRACHAALSILSSTREYGAEIQSRYGVEFNLRIGLNSGLVVVGSIGDELRMDYTADGDTTNLAARMEAAAAPGSIYASYETYKQTRSMFNFNHLGHLKIKGKREPVKAYRLVSARKDIPRPRLGIERTIFSEMVGRERDLSRLELQVIKTINGQGSIVSLIGEAGIGKSRLIAELAKSEHTDQMRLLEGSASSIGLNLSFDPIIGILKQWAQIGWDDTEKESLEKLEIAIGLVDPDKVEEILPFIATLMGYQLTGYDADRLAGIKGEALEWLIIKSLRELLISAARRRPLAIIMEDLHWADLSTLNLLESLFSLTVHHPILFINSFRPGYKRTSIDFRTVLTERYGRQYFEIVLEPLDESKSEDLISNMLNIEGLPLGLKNRIVQRAGGNPFFIEEVVRCFIDQGAVQLRQDRYEATDKINTVVIPHTIFDLLMARIDRLEQETRSLVKIASVIGRSFFYTVLAEVAKHVHDIDARLNHLIDIQLLKKRRRMEELEYLFKHALTQEVAYESILQGKRRLMHIQVASAVEKVFRSRLPEFYGLLAYHYTRGEKFDEAEDYLTKAGAEALKSSASMEALKYFQEALALYLQKHGAQADPERLAELEKNIALASYNKGLWENALTHIDNVLQRWRQGSPKSGFARGLNFIYHFLGVVLRLYSLIGAGTRSPDQRQVEIFDLSYKKAISLVELDPKRCFIEYIRTLHMLTKFDISKVPNGIGMWMSASGLFSWTGFSFRLSDRMLNYCKNVVDKNDVQQRLYYSLFNNIHLALEGSWARIANIDHELVTQALRSGEIWHASLYLLFHGYVAIGRGDIKTGDEIIARLDEIAEDYGVEFGKEYSYTLRTISLINIRKLNQALETVNEGLQFMKRTSSEMIILYYFGFRAIIEVLLKNFDKAKQSLHQAHELILKQGHVPPIYQSSYKLGRLMLDVYLIERNINKRGPKGQDKYLDRAAKSSKSALRISKKIAFTRIENHRFVGVYHWLKGNTNKALTHWNASIVQAQNMGARIELARTYREIGKRLMERNRGGLTLNGLTGEAYIQTSRQMFQEMNLAVDLRAVERIGLGSGLGLEPAEK